MKDLREQLADLLQGRVCVVGVGNPDFGDDGFGVRLAKELGALWENNTTLSVFVAGTAPERFLRSARSSAERGGPDHIAESRIGVAAGSEVPRQSADWRGELLRTVSPRAGGEDPCAERDYDQVLFLDAVDFGGAPGEVVLLNSAEMEARFPQISTHKISLGLLARLVEANGKTKAWLLGVQPESLVVGRELSPIVQRTLELLIFVLQGSARGSPSAAAVAQVSKPAVSQTSESAGLPSADPLSTFPDRPLQPC